MEHQSRTVIVHQKPMMSTQSSCQPAAARRGPKGGQLLEKWSAGNRLTDIVPACGNGRVKNKREKE